MTDRKTMTSNPWLPLEKYADLRVAQAMQRAAEQQRRCAAALRQQEAIDHYAQDLKAKSNDWMTSGTGCRAFLLNGVQQFQTTVQAVSVTQKSNLENLLLTRATALESLHTADLYRRRIAAVADRHERALKQAAQKLERRLEDDLRRGSTAWEDCGEH
ncbi:hypothetical protein HF289_10835 [Acidithiobacillus ferrooxidans]|uniref:hypothetical protein n=1 Tax=Acidithiobacillus ferrooxidans TaxID=920 RepID=UPI001C07A574|nr:hypothetical protein [Acidithiobacillus ferrooxidans]MBU2857340.1 hypothetical protein [Acidithiobacillus ferrooxidans]